MTDGYKVDCVSILSGSGCARGGDMVTGLSMPAHCMLLYADAMVTMSKRYANII